MKKLANIIKKVKNLNEVIELENLLNKTEKVLPGKNNTVLPALKSNNLAFDIFKYIEQPKALLRFRSLSRKALEKSKFLYSFTNPLIFSKTVLEQCPAFKFQIGVIMSRS